MKSYRKILKERWDKIPNGLEIDTRHDQFFREADRLTVPNSTYTSATLSILRLAVKLKIADLISERPLKVIKTGNFEKEDKIITPERKSNEVDMSRLAEEILLSNHKLREKLKKLQNDYSELNEDFHTLKEKNANLERDLREACEKRGFRPLSEVQALINGGE